MVKLDSIENLAKAVGGLVSHFKKAAAHHKALSEAHETMATAHKAHHEFAKAKHEGMDDGDAHKAYFAKVAELHKAKADHHTKKAALHKAHSEHLDTLGDSLGEEKTAAQKAAGGAEVPATDPNAPKGDGVASMIEKTTNALVAKALDSLNTDPKVAEAIQKVVLDQVQAALAGKIVPDNVKGVLPSAPATDSQLIPRAGGALPVDTSKVDPTLAKMVDVPQ